MTRILKSYPPHVVQLIRTRNRIIAPVQTNFDCLIAGRYTKDYPSDKDLVKSKISKALVNNHIAKKIFISLCVYGIYDEDFNIKRGHYDSDTYEDIIKSGIHAKTDPGALRESKYPKAYKKDSMNVCLFNSSDTFFEHYFRNIPYFYSKNKKTYKIFKNNDLFKRNKSELKWLLNKCKEQI